jgi:hypothetical protein
MYWFPIIGVILLTAGSLIAYMLSRRVRETDLGAVSDRWIAQHRADAPFE